MRPWASILIDTHFIDERRGWVVGGKTDEPTPTRKNVKAVVLYTENGGQTWVNRAADLEATLPKGEWGWKIQFSNDNIGFVSLENFTAGAILKSTDGGMSWHRIDITDPQKNANLEGVGFVNENPSCCHSSERRDRRSLPRSFRWRLVTTTSYCGRGSRYCGRGSREAGS
jgi:photosystem II stability/assembly factor-like uncharacterized protein